MKNYQEVPNIITGKDLDYLSDMFQWNYVAYKKYIAYSDLTTMDDLREIFNESSNLFHNNMTQVLSILKEGVNSNEQ